MSYILLLSLFFAVELLYFRIATCFNIIDKPNSRSSHNYITLRGGGVIFYFGALTWFLLNHFEYTWFIIGLSLISLVSFVDDIKSISARARLLIHFISMLFLFYQWDLFSLSWWLLPVALILCIAILNAYNFMDGINGMTGGYSLVVLLSLIYINHSVVYFIEPSFLYTVTLSVVVFNFFNFRKRARCFAGDVGSISVAFIIIFLIGKLILLTGDISWIILLVVYGIDASLTIIHRLLLRENISQPHRKHMYQLMANELKIPHYQVALIYMGTQALFTLAYLVFRNYPYIFLIFTILTLTRIYIAFMNKYFHLHNRKHLPLEKKDWYSNPCNS
ncbi:MAG: glycosyltransferase family 4 protein [Bacteroides sp.]|nr:glycosyltransferase family 4 protein [Bacteroides sp.]